MRKFALFCLSMLLLLTAVGCETSLILEEPTAMPPPPTLQVNLPTATLPPAPLVVDTVASDGGVEAEVLVVTPSPESTAVPTETPTATPLPELVIQPPLQPADPNNLPATTRDLLFVADGALKLWTAHNRQIVELVADGVTDMAVSADGNRVLVARQTFEGDVTVLIDAPFDDSEELVEFDVRYTEHELLLIDTVSKQSRVVAPVVPLLQEIALSPNGQVITFVAHDVVSKQESEPFEFPSLSLYLARPGSGELRPLQACDLFCSDMVWREDSELMVYSDYVGLWLYNVNGATPEILIEGGEDVEIGFPRYEPQEWSRNGRTVLLRQLRGNGAGPLFVYDLVARTRSEIPNSAAYSTPTLMSVDWLDDARLLLMYSPYNPLEVNGTRLELWRFNPDGNNSLVLDEGVSLRPDQPVRGDGVIHLEDGRFAYALTHETDPTVAGLYIQTSLTTPAERIGALPVGLAEPDITWSPDGSGAMVQWGNVTYLAQTDGAGVALTAVLGGDVSQLGWLAPATAVRGE